MSMKKISALAVAAFMLVAVAVPASAQTVDVDALKAQIAQLTAMIAQLQGGTTTTGTSTGGYQFTSNLTIGSTGADVTELQKVLVAKGYLVMPAGVAYGNFGPLTQAAVAKWQAAAGISPAAGYVGPISRTALNAMAGTTTTTTTTTTTSTGTLTGGAGSISDVDYVSKLSNEEVGEGATDVQVAGLEIEADDESDLAITAVNLNFSPGTANRDFDKYADEVSVWFDGKKVATIDADEFEDDDNFDKTISLGSGNVIKAGASKELVVAVSGINNLDSGDEGETWTLEFESVRFVDAQGAVITDADTGDINDNTGRTFSFEDFASASNVELKVSSGDDKINDARTIGVDTDNNTDNVDFFSFEIEAKGDSDITIDDLPIYWTSVGAQVGQIINSAELVIDGKSIDTETVSIAATTGTTTFSGIDYTVKAGDKVEVVVKVDLNDLDGSFTEGDTLMAEFGEVQTDSTSFDAEDEEGNDLVDADKTGSATTDAHTFYENGIEVSFVSGSASDKGVDGNDNDYTDLFIKFDVTAFGDEDLYIPSVLTAISTSTNATGGAPTLAQGIGYHIQLNSVDQLASTTIAAVIDATTAEEETSSYLVEAGQTESFTLKITVTNDGALDGRQVRAVLTGINFANTDSATGDSVFTSNLQDTFRSSYGRISD